MCTNIPCLQLSRELQDFLHKIIKITEEAKTRTRWCLHSGIAAKPQARTNFVTLHSLQAQPTCSDQSWNDAAFI